MHDASHLLTTPPPRGVLQRQPSPEREDDDCRIRSPHAYIYFEMPRRFHNPNDDNPAVVKRARCLKEAAAMLGPADAIELAQLIIKRDRGHPVYAGYAALATPTRIALAEILVDIINRKTTEAYLARLLFATAVTPYDNPGIDKPVIKTVKVSGQFLQITLDKTVLSAAAATLFGGSECDKFVFGFKQFVTDDNFVADYYVTTSKSHVIMDSGVDMRKSLPCHDVFADGDIWSYSSKLDCSSKEAEKTLDATQMLAFMDAPSTAALTMEDKPDWVLSGVTWTNKFITIFAVMLPNGVVHHVSWFSWDIQYCENFPLRSVGKRPGAAGRKVTIGTIQEGAPPSPYAAMVGSPAPKACNTILHAAKPEIFTTKDALVTCS